MKERKKETTCKKLGETLSATKKKRYVQNVIYNLQQRIIKRWKRERRGKGRVSQNRKKS